MTKLTIEEVADVMYRSRLRYEGHDEDSINRIINAGMASDDDTLDSYFEEATLIVDWIDDNEPEARAIAALLLGTPPEFKFNDGLIFDALIERRQGQFIPGEEVVLICVPAGLLNGLPEEDQEAIREIVGKPVTFIGSNKEATDAILQFKDKDGDGHQIWVDLVYIRPVEV